MNVRLFFQLSLRPVRTVWVANAHDSGIVTSTMHVVRRLQLMW